jgi:phosphoheptose isomerase
MSARHADLFREVAATMAAAAEGSLPAEIERAVDVIDRAFVDGQKLLVFGNGGSSATRSTWSRSWWGALRLFARRFRPSR